MDTTRSGEIKVGLALSGGGVRGLAHIGVLEVLHRENIPIDVIAGTSAGAIVGAVYACHRDISLMKTDALEPGWKKYRQMIDPSFPISGLVKGRKIKDLINSYLGGKKLFRDLSIPFACVATDIDTGEEVVIDSGPVTDAIRASISIPGIFTVAKYEGRYLVDGGLTTPVPVNVARRMGADIVIAVNVSPLITERVSRPKKDPNIFQVMLQSIYIGSTHLIRSGLEAADIVVEPDLGNIAIGDFQKSQLLIARGIAAAEQALPEIRNRLDIH